MIINSKYIALKEYIPSGNPELFHFSLNNKKQETNLIDALKSTCRKFTKQKTGKRPLTNINLVRI